MADSSADPYAASAAAPEYGIQSMLPGSVLANKFHDRNVFGRGLLWPKFWAGYDLESRQPIRHKRFYPEWIADETKKSGIIEEARRIATLNHPNGRGASTAY